MLDNPAGLWALLGLPVVLAIHLLHRRSKRTRISTLFLIEDLPLKSESGRAIERLRSSPALWFQLAAVTVLAWVLARPMWLRPESRASAVLVLDSSASMRAFRPAAREAVRDAIRRIEGAAAHADWTLLESEPGRAVLYRGPDTVAFLDALDRWDPLAGSHDPLPVLQTARDLARGGGLAIFVTDRAPPGPPPPGIDWIAVGRPLENAGICGASVRPDGAGAAWEAMIANRGTTPAKRSWRLEHEGGSSPPAAIELPPGGLTVLRGEVPPGVSDFRLVLDPDAFDLDDSAPLLVPRPKPLRIRIRADGEARSLFERMASGLDGAAMSPDEADLEFAVLRAEATVPTDRNGLYIVNAGPSTNRLAADPILVRPHPLVDGLAWQGLLAPDTPGLTALRPQDEALAWQGPRPLILLRESGASSQLVYNFDALRSNAGRLPAFFITALRFANRVRASTPGYECRIVETGQGLDIPAGPAGSSPVELRESNRVTRSLPVPSDGRVELPAPSRPGRFSVSRDGRTLLDGAAIFVDARESDFSACSATNTLPDRVKALAARNSRDDLFASAWLAGLGLLMAGSWWAAGRRGA